STAATIAAIRLTSTAHLPRYFLLVGCFLRQPLADPQHSGAAIHYHPPPADGPVVSDLGRSISVASVGEQHRPHYPPGGTHQPWPGRNSRQLRVEQDKRVA